MSDRLAVKHHGIVFIFGEIERAPPPSPRPLAEQVAVNVEAVAETQRIIRVVVRENSVQLRFRKTRVIGHRA